MQSGRFGSWRLSVSCWLAALTMFLGATSAALAQTEPGTAAPGDPFEVHGLLYSGSAPAGYPLGDGWAQGTSFLGVLDENGNPALDASGHLFRASRQIDQNWGNQGHGFDLTVFAGGNKNHDLIGAGDTPWAWDVGGGGPQKNDITNAYFHTRVDPLTGDRWVFVAAETRSINGDSHVDFEFNQAGVVKVGTDEGELIGLGPDGGRTVNDFLISIDFEQGGEAPIASVRFWNGSTFELVSIPGAAFSSTNFVDIPHGSNGTWKHYTDDGAETDVLTHLQLVEGAANLSALGIGVNPCATDATFMVKARSSASWTSDLKDFAIVRFPLEPPPEIQFTSPDRVCNGASFEVSAKELTGLPNTTLQWQASGCGTITSDPVGSTITVQADAACNCQITLSVTAAGGECLHVTVAETVVTVGDEVTPVLSDQPEDFTVECDAVPLAVELTATDDCSDVSVDLSEGEETGTCAGSSTITRTWSTADACSNGASHTQTVTVEDTTAPVLSGVPADAAASCDAVPVPADVTASDNCSDAPVELAEVTEPGTCNAESGITRTWTATDACGNQVSQSQVITVSDDTAPALSGVPADVTVECDAVPAAAEVSATDNCSDPAVQLDENTESGQCVGEFTVTRAWTATDDCGNQTPQTQVVTVVDTTAPELAGVPANATVECSAIPDPAPVTATDNCSEPTVEFNEEIAAGPGDGKGMITRTWTATDSCGNQTTGTQLLTVIDTTAPELHGVPADVTVECDAIPEPPVVTATDNCATPPVEYNETIESGGCNGQLTITRTWTATDDCGNSITQSQTITVVDTTVPELAGGPENITVECDAVPVPAEVTATDNCSEPTVELSEVAEPGDCDNRSTITRTWTATDECGNQATHVQVINVVDTTSPTLSGDPADLTVECDSVPDAITLTATDNCDPDVPVNMTEQKTPGTCPADYELLRTWSAADDCGNEADVDRVVNVQDTTPPTVKLDPNGTQYICDGLPVDYRLTTSDNCVDAQFTIGDIVAITSNSRDQVTVTPLPDSTVTISVPGPAWVSGTFTASDGCGNASDSFEFTVLAEIGQEACSQGFWKNHFDRWEPTGYSPDDLFLDAFQITDLSSPEIPSDFNVNLTLGVAASNTSGSLGQLLVHGTGALLNAAHPDVEYPATVDQIRIVMQAAFAGSLTFDEARAFFGVWNAAERECGCPIQ